ncbi:ABC transporter permease [Paratractidigestivibacter sp.]|uniref:ABC transporter permease n=1 Tax=Paratractidigestivibacter sp. TaxID=2847316 RepID=UPI002AC92E3C|nr:ABC transporter permease [Paratractidigestivibacter sp.]
MSPLIKRLPRELRNNPGKYVGIFLLMCGAIAMTSGFLLSCYSISELIVGMRETYNIEDGRFTTTFEATDAQLDAATDAAEPAGGVTIYKNYTIDADLNKADGDDGTNRTLRTYAHRTEVDLAAYAEGEEPAGTDEVAIDRVFATNNNLAIGDRLELEGRTYTICGILTLADSQALFLNNSDFTVNTITFGVAEVSEAGFSALEEAGGAPAYIYSFCFTDRDLTVAERTDAEKDMVSALTDEGARVIDLTDADSNQGISYATDDIDGDSAIWETLLLIIVAIMAFIFVVLTSGTIEEESAIIGTLLASGYRRREVVAHYLALPTIVGAVAALLGTALGTQFMMEPMKNLYYGSYSLPPFVLSWDWSIVAKTAVAPFVVLVGITLVGLLRKMGKTPLQFLRHEASGKSGTKRGFTLPERMGFVARFRLRVFLRNLGNFVTLFLGIAFAALLMLFSLGVLPTMQHYADNLKNSLVAEHQYTLKAPLELEGTSGERETWQAVARLQQVDGTKLDELQDAADASDLTALYEKLDDVASDLGVSRQDVLDMVEKVEDIDLDDENIHPVNTTDNGASKISQAEKYAVYTLEYDRGAGNGTETITVYGILEDSAYWKDVNVGDGRVVVGAGLVDKFGWQDGEKISLDDKYEGKTREVTYAGSSCTWGANSNMNLYMSLADFNEFFGNDADYFNGYASNEALTFDSTYYAGDTTPDDMQAVGDQFVDMMGEMLGTLVGLSVFIFVLFIYLLTKAVIDRSARSISYMKVFGYRDGEISKLYVRSITICVVASLVLSMPLIIVGLKAIFKAMLVSYSGNIQIWAPASVIAETMAAGFVSYLVVALLHMRSIRRVPMAEALKVQE